MYFIYVVNTASRADSIEPNQNIRDQPAKFFVQCMFVKIGGGGY